LAKLAWDQVGQRFFQTGVDRGVLYLTDSAVAWNGLTSVDVDSDNDLQSYYLDGAKYLQTVSPSDFAGKMKALTYPEEFDSVNGIENEDSGLSYYNQKPESFNLSYRTRIGNDLDGVDHGYKIHILYNVMASPDSYSYQTLQETLTPIEFGWTLSATPPFIDGHRPTSHISIDSTKVNPLVLESIETSLYGSAISNPYLPTIEEIITLLEQFGSLIIVDNGDGTWTAIDAADQYITMTNSTTFEIDNVDATYSDVSTYTVSTTNPD